MQLTARFTLETAFRAALTRPMSDKEMVRIAREERAQRPAKRLKKA